MQWSPIIDFCKSSKSRNISGYSMKDDAINAGANYVDQPAVVDKNIVTTAHYKDMGPWIASVIKLLKIMNEYNLLMNTKT